MICCVTGHRPEGFPFPYGFDNDRFNTYLCILEDTVEELMYEGYTHFISGMADGVDLDFAWYVRSLSNNFEGIIFESALPYPLRPSSISSEEDCLRRTLVCESEKVTEVSPKYFRGCMQKRNRYMVDNADLVLAVWNGEKHGGTWYTINYARKKGKPIRYIMLKDISPDYSIIDKYLLAEKVREMIEKEEHLCRPDPDEYR